MIVEGAMFMFPWRPDKKGIVKQLTRVAVTAFKKDGLKNHTERKMLLPSTKITHRTKYYVFRHHLFKEGVWGGRPREP